MQINIPERLTPLDALNFANFLSNCPVCDEYIYDFKRMQHCRPYGLLVIGAAIRNNIEKYPNATHTMINTDATQGGQFATTFGFYQSIGQDIGEAKEEHDHGDRYVPIKKISAKDIHAKYPDTIVLNTKIERHSGELADMLVGDQPQNVRDAIRYCFREIIRNTFEHAHVSELWVCGQYWPTRDEAEIAILDEGIGILRSLQSNRRINAKCCEEANVLAVQPGLSRTIGEKQDPFDAWQNSGYGLYVASTLCALNGGYFILASGDNALNISGDGQCSYDCVQGGTSICVNVRINSKKLQHFDKTLNAIVAEGEKKARGNAEARILTASKVTTIASLLRNIEDSVDGGIANTVSHVGEDRIPINTVVQFEAQLSQGNGEVFGKFEYNGKQYYGVLRNVNRINRVMYVEKKMKIPAIVRKAKGELYTLLEKHKFEKANKMK